MESGNVRLFQSHREDCAHGEQQRDFVYVKDCVEVMWWLLNHEEVNGLVNLGTGVARSWNDLVRAVFDSLGRPAVIEYIPMPETLHMKYQYLTRASKERLRSTGCPLPFRSLEDSVGDYVTKHLKLGGSDCCEPVSLHT
jgi:ADP-L-glycero-D-manno-heptose 6-epimerase